jgi:hypothetical protein
VTSLPEQVIPSPVRAVRILLWAAVVLTVFAALNELILVGGAAGAGVALAVLLPAAASAFAAISIKTRPGRRLWVGIIALEGFYLLWQVGRLVAGDPSGVLGLAIPIAIVVLIATAPARAYFR